MKFSFRSRKKKKSEKDRALEFCEFFNAMLLISHGTEKYLASQGRHGDTLKLVSVLFGIAIKVITELDAPGASNIGKHVDRVQSEFDAAGEFLREVRRKREEENANKE